MLRNSCDNYLDIHRMVDGGDASENAELLRIFTFYIFSEKPTLTDGQTFASAADAPVFRIKSAAGRDYGPGSLFNNPYGTWRLEPVASPGMFAEATKRFRKLLH